MERIYFILCRAVHHYVWWSSEVVKTEKYV